MRDASDNYTIKKTDIFSLPMRVLAIGRTGCGKSSVALGNLLLRNEFYRKDFKPDNIYVFSGSLKGDLKLQIIVEELDLPKCNLFDTFDENVAHMIYDNAVDNYKEAVSNNETPEHILFIFDDLGFTNLQNKNKKNSILDKIFSNGRKYLISIITCNQRMTQLSTNAREQASGLMLWSSTNKQLELVENDFNYLSEGGGKTPKRRFLEMVKNHTQNIHDFIVFDLGKKEMYRNKDFKPICICTDGTNKCGGSIVPPED
tara:strand:+ start:91 stop:864 length:774 start_codon:yes stop_codon:yes gene_type:complete